MQNSGSGSVPRSKAEMPVDLVPEFGIGIGVGIRGGMGGGMPGVGDIPRERALEGAAPVYAPGRVRRGAETKNAGGSDAAGSTLHPFPTSHVSQRPSCAAVPLCRRDRTTQHHILSTTTTSCVEDLSEAGRPAGGTSYALEPYYRNLLSLLSFVFAPYLCYFICMCHRIQPDPKEQNIFLCSLCSRLFRQPIKSGAFGRPPQTVPNRNLSPRQERHGLS